MSNLVITVDIMAGTDIDVAIKESLELANKLNVCVDFTFNQKYIFCPPNDTLERVKEMWWIKSFQEKAPDASQES